MSIDTGLAPLTYQANYPVANVDQSTQQFRDNFAILKASIENLQAAASTSGSVVAITTSVQSNGQVRFAVSFQGNALKLPQGNPSGSAQEGMIRYNASSGLPEFYNGTTWTTIGTGAGASGDYLPLTGGTVTGNVTVTADIVCTGTVQAAYFDGYVESPGADLAERYATDATYDAGTVVVFGGTAEITQATTANDTRLAGVISTDPAFVINDDVGTDSTHPCVALIGRVPCKVVGIVNKGDMLTTSTTPGHAQRATSPVLGAIIGKALENHTSSGTGVIEISVQRC